MAIGIDHDVGGPFILSTDFGSLDVDRRPMVVVVVVAAAIECVTCDVYFIIVVMFMVNDVFEIIK